jgi:diguanylate cyclase (GGDEF)-like protein/PAS domain S-box-containing protein
MKQPLRVLLVEDSQDDALLLVQELRRGGYQPTYERVETAQAMRAALERQDWQIIFTDQAMPHFSARGALEVLQQSGRSIPLLLVSGNIEAEQVVQLLKAGVQDYINKRDLTRLVPAVERELRQAESNRQRHRAEQQLRLLGTAVSAAANAIFITNGQGEIQWANDAFARLSGYNPADLVGTTPRILKSGVQETPFYEALWQLILAGQVWAGELVNRRKDGMLYTVHQTITPVLDDEGKVSHFIAVQEDISRRKEAEAKVEYLAYHDPLTGLPNRVLFLDRLSQALSRAVRESRLVALLFLDLDQFKLINDTLGHASGDQLLKEVGERVKKCLRAADTVARLGGDEFAIIEAGLASVDGAVHLAERVLRALARPFKLSAQEVNATCSIGITVYPLDDPEGSRLLENADLAMYLAKAEGRNRFAFFRESLNAQTRERRELEVGLSQAVANRQLVLYYQPQVDLVSGAVVGMEALVRWQHPTRGLLLPASFLPIAEASGLILPLSDFIIHEGCAQNRAWQAGPAAGLRLAINVSASHLYNSLLLETVTEALARTGLEPKYLELELTETALIRDEETAVRVMEELHGLGVLFSVDDFGTGYSSLKHLKQLPVKKLKIDQSFVRHLPHDPDDAAIVRATIGLGHELGLRVIAEGVETAEQLAFLKEHRCDEAQGYYFSRPVPPETFEKLLARRVVPAASLVAV